LMIGRQWVVLALRSFYGGSCHCCKGGSSKMDAGSEYMY
jgi:hypothetical protein